MAAKDGCFVVAELLGDAIDGRIELTGDRLHSLIKTQEFRGNGGGVEMQRLAPRQNVIDAKRPRDHDPRRYGYASLVHGVNLGGA